MDLNLEIYKLCNHDLKNMTSDELINHWQNHGQFENRIHNYNSLFENYKIFNPFTNITFDKLYYFLKNQKIVYDNHSFYEEYPYFNIEKYRNNNEDLKYFDDKYLMIHYHNHGKYENRICSIKVIPVKKIIGFSLWGEHEFYNYGMLENVLIAKELYNDWICRIYYDNCDEKILNELKKCDNVELVDMTNSNFVIKLMWRFIPIFTEENIIFISRDSDSRLNIKEKMAVDEWLKSNYDFHIMRDHIAHHHNIMGGMWGARNNILLNLKDIFYQYAQINSYNIDQQFLAEIIYPKIKFNSMIHDSNYKLERNTNDFPECDYHDFVGSYINECPKTFKLLNENPRKLKIVHMF